MKNVYNKLKNNDNVEVIDYTRDSFKTIIVECSDVTELQFVKEHGYEIKSKGDKHFLNQL